MARPFVPLPDAVQVEARFTLLGQEVEMRWYELFDHTPTAEDMISMNLDFENWIATILFPSLSSQLQLREIVSTDWSSNSGLQETYVPPGTVVGGQGGAMLPNQIAVVASLRTGRRGRSFRGRTYIPGATEAELSDSNTLSPASAAAFSAIMLDIPGFGTSWPYRLVIGSFYSGVDAQHKPIPRVTGIATPVDAISIDPVLGSQRRRRPGIGI